MQLAIITPYPPRITGIGQYGYHVSRLLAGSGVFSEITILTGRNGAARQDVAPSIKLVDGWHPNRWGIARDIQKIFRGIRPDLVWFNLGVSVFGRDPLANVSGFLSILGVKRYGFPIVVTLHELPETADLNALQAPGGFLAAYGARFLTYLATRGDVTCLTTRPYVDWMSARYPGLNFVHIPLGARGRPEPLSPTNASEILLFTTLAPFKGVELLLQAYKTLKPTNPDLRLTIAGAEHDRFPGYIDRVRRAYHDLEGVRWMGQVPDSAVRGLFQRAQLVVLPYLASTGSSSVLWKGAMYGRPMITSDLAEFRSVVKSAGLKVTFFRRDDANSLVNAIRLALASRASLQEQVRVNLAAIRRHHPQKTCQAYLRAFNLAFEVRSSPIRIPQTMVSEDIP